MLIRLSDFVQERVLLLRVTCVFLPHGQARSDDVITAAPEHSALNFH